MKFFLAGSGDFDLITPIKPAAPLLACVIRRVFFCPDVADIWKGGGHDLF